MNYLVYCDGACSNNGNALDAVASGSFAAYMLGESAKYSDDIHEKLMHEKPIIHKSRFSISLLGEGPATNNVAEATTLGVAISWLIENNLLVQENTVHVCMDSQLILTQMIGMAKVRNTRLRMIYQGIYANLARASEKVGYNVEPVIHFHWISGDLMKQTIIGH